MQVKHMAEAHGMARNGSPHHAFSSNTRTHEAANHAVMNDLFPGKPAAGELLLPSPASCSNGIFLLLSPRVFGGSECRTTIHGFTSRSDVRSLLPAAAYITSCERERCMGGRMGVVLC